MMRPYTATAALLTHVSMRPNSRDGCGRNRLDVARIRHVGHARDRAAAAAPDVVDRLRRSVSLRAASTTARACRAARWR